MVEPPCAADGLDRWSSSLRRVRAWLELPVSLLSWAVSARGLTFTVLLLMGGLSFPGLLRPPISADLNAFNIPLFPTDGDAAWANRVAYGPRPLHLLSPGGVICAALVLGIGIVTLRSRWSSAAVGMMTCGLLLAVSAAAFNHPSLVDEFDRQSELRDPLISVLERTVLPATEVSALPRVQSSISADRGSLFRGFLYVHYVYGLLVTVGLVAIIFIAQGRLGRRTFVAAAWCLAALAVAGSLGFRRFSAEWQWAAAERADWRGEPELAHQRATAALDAFPSLKHLRQRWEFLGLTDLRRGRDSAESRLFVAAQWARAGSYRHALSELEALSLRNAPTPDVQRWLADTTAQWAFQLFDLGHLQAAEEAWSSAYDRDPSQIHRRLYVAALRARAERYDPDALAGLMEPSLRRMADRTLRASLQAMLGDCFFECGRFAEARRLYGESMRSYSLPKQINYRAMRGTIGM